MTKTDLQTILNNINALHSGNQDSINEYVQLVKMAAEKLQTLQNEDKSPMLDAWLNMGLQEIRNEMSGRLKNNLEGIAIDKLKTEFMYSKSTVTMALTNVMMHL